MISDAISQDRISRIVGYDLKKGNFNTTSPNLPQRIAIFAEANEANQSTLDTDGNIITSAKQAGELYGYGSPMHIIARVLFPIYSNGVGGIPVVAYAQPKAVGAAAKILSITPSGVATANGTHYLVIAGRKSLDGVSYAINILKGDTTADITEKIEDAINNVLGCPFSATATDYHTTVTSKWKGLTADGLSITVDTGNNALGLTYSVMSTQSGSGTPDIAGGLAQFGNVWNTHVINSYGTVSTTLDSLEQFNGVPDPENPTGRYQGIVMKPFIALTGSVDEDPSSITDTRSTQVTIAICPAPLSAGLAMEAAANMEVLFANQCSENPHLDVAGQSYLDMPTPTAIGAMSDYNNRDAIVKKGCSTVDLVNGAYQIQDFITTYHPSGETPPQFRYCRNLNLDFNVRYGYYILEQQYVVDHAIAKDSDIVSVDKVIKPKQWIQVLNAYAEDLANRALIVDTAFMQKSIVVNLSTNNPDRFETFFEYKRSGFVRQAATTAEAGFNFGTLN